jgi:hypothetical protein
MKITVTGGVIEVGGRSGPVIVIPGARPGPPGPKGDAGTSYEHTQASAAATWTIAHNLGQRPSVSLFSVGGLEMIGSITHLSLNVVQVDFNTPVAGTARLL